MSVAPGKTPSPRQHGGLFLRFVRGQYKNFQKQGWAVKITLAIAIVGALYGGLGKVAEGASTVLHWLRPTATLHVDVVRPIPYARSSGPYPLKFPAGIDIIVRNTGNQAIVIEDVNLTVESWRDIPAPPDSGCALPLLPFAEYRAVWEPGQKHIVVKLAEAVPAKGADRLQIFIETLGGNEPHCPAGFTLQIVPTFTYSGSRQLSSRRLGVSIPDFEGVPAEAGLTIATKVNLLLTSHDYDVVTSMIGALASVGGSEAESALLTLQSRDLSYLTEEGQAASTGDIAELGQYLSGAIKQAQP